DEDLPEPLQGRLLGLQRLVKLALGDLSALDENRPETVLERALGAVGGNDASRQERDEHRLLPALQGGHAGLPLDADALKAVREAEARQRPVKCHSHPPAGPGGRAERRLPRTQNPAASRPSRMVTRRSGCAVPAVGSWSSRGRSSSVRSAPDQAALI